MVYPYTLAVHPEMAVPPGVAAAGVWGYAWGGRARGNQGGKRETGNQGEEEYVGSDMHLWETSSIQGETTTPYCLMEDTDLLASEWFRISGPGRSETIRALKSTEHTYQDTGWDM